MTSLLGSSSRFQLFNFFLILLDLKLSLLFSFSIPLVHFQLEPLISS